MGDYQRLISLVPAIEVRDMFLFDITAEEKEHVVKQFNRALLNAKGEGTDMAEIFLKPLASSFPTWGDTALVYGLCYAKEGSFKEAEVCLTSAVNGMMVRPDNLAIAQEALKNVRDDMKNPELMETIKRQPGKRKIDAGTGEASDRVSMQAPILMKASRNPAKAQMASEREIRSVMMKAASSRNGDLPDDDVVVEDVKTPADRMRFATKVIGVLLALTAIFLLIYFWVIPTAAKVKQADTNQQQIDYLLSKLNENSSDPEVKAVLDDFVATYDIDTSETAAPSDAAETEAVGTDIIEQNEG